MASCSIGDFPDRFYEKWVIARTRHVCTECGSPIDPGEGYKRIDGIWDGKWAHFKHCEICNEAFNEAYHEGQCPAYGELWAYLGM